MICKRSLRRGVSPFLTSQNTDLKPQSRSECIAHAHDESLNGGVKRVTLVTLVFVVQTPIPDTGSEMLCELEMKLRLQVEDKIRITAATDAEDWIKRNPVGNRNIGTHDEHRINYICGFFSHPHTVDGRLGLEMAIS